MREKIKLYLATRLAQPMADAMFDLYVELIGQLGVYHRMSIQIYMNIAFFNYLVQYYLDYELE